MVYDPYGSTDPQGRRLPTRRVVDDSSRGEFNHHQHSQMDITIAKGIGFCFALRKKE